jgi:hypothetical protein
MRKTLSALALLLAVTALAADDDPAQLPAKPLESKTVSKDAERHLKMLDDLQRDLEARQKELQRAVELQEGIARKVGEENAEYKIRQAKLEADHKVQLATLEKEMLAAADAQNAANREVNRVASELNRHRMQPGGDAWSPFGMPGWGGDRPPAGFPGAGFGGDQGFPIGGRGDRGLSGGGLGGGVRGKAADKGVARSVPESQRGVQSIEQKLDTILSKLEEVETRLRRLETAPRR